MSWLAQVCNCFLIRNPREVIASYARTRPEVTVSDVGVLQQAEIFEHARRDFTVAQRRWLWIPAMCSKIPRAMLTALCAALEVPFSERMLSWPAGARSSDGVWARYWYDAVNAFHGLFALCFQGAHAAPAARAAGRGVRAPLPQPLRATITPMNETMQFERYGVGQPIRRKEDQRFLTGTPVSTSMTSRPCPAWRICMSYCAHPCPRAHRIHRHASRGRGAGCAGGAHRCRLDRRWSGRYPDAHRGQEQ